MTKDDLIKYSAGQVKSNKKLFSRFVELYLESGGRQSDCFGCVFSSTFNKWKYEAIGKNQEKKTIMSYKNTFKLSNKAPKTIYIPMSGSLLLPSSSDELAIMYLTQNDKKNFEDRSKLFDKLPDALIKEQPKKKVKKSK